MLSEEKHLAITSCYRATMSDEYVEYMCTAETFKPDTHYPVRWIDVEQDYDLVRAFWPSDLSQDEWHSFKGMGYTYAAVAAGSPHAARIGLMSLCGALPKV